MLEWIATWSPCDWAIKEISLLQFFTQIKFWAKLKEAHFKKNFWVTNEKFGRVRYIFSSDFSRFVTLKITQCPCF